MNFIRKYSTPLSMAGFLIIGVTGVLMFAGIRNSQINTLHEWFGIAFVVVAILHILRNGKAFLAMLKQPQGLVIVGLIGGLGLVATGASLATTGAGRGNPNHAAFMVVQRLADAPISQVAPVLGMPADQAVARLRQGGVTVKSADERLTDVAQNNQKTAPQLFQLMLPNAGGHSAPGNGRHRGSGAR